MRQKMVVKERILIWAISFGAVFDGIVGVLTLGCIRPNAQLALAKKLAKWRFKNRS